MPKHVYEVEVGPEAIDALGHVNNVEYLRWMQDAATSHSDAIGCTAATRAAGAAWVVRTHRIEYFRPALVGDRIRVRTWVADVRRATSLRRYEIFREGEETALAAGETDWVYVDAGTGRPRTIPEPIRALFQPAPEGE